jgi:hypothetical protein
VPRTTSAVVLAGVAIAASLGLGGCGDDKPSQPAGVETLPPTSEPAFAAPPSPTETTAPLPPPEALTDVMVRLTDPNVPGADKLSLIENPTPADAAALDRIATALRDSGFRPMSFEARDLTWAQSHPGNVTASIVVKTPNPQAGGDFTFPMEFSPNGGSWQLTRQTADLLLTLGQGPTATPTR